MWKNISEQYQVLVIGFDKLINVYIIVTGDLSTKIFSPYIVSMVHLI